MSIQRKQIIVNVYSPSTGALITTWAGANMFGFSKELDGGPGECIISLDKAFDYGGNDLLVGNEVEIRISDKDTLSNVWRGDKARTIYRGYISLIERNIDGHKESVTVHLLGFYTLLSLDILKNGAQTTLYSDAAAGVGTASPAATADIGLMMRGVIDRYRAETANPKISYDIENIPDTGTTGQYTFKQKTYREAMDKIKQMAPSGTHYYIDEDGKIKFTAKPTTPTHRFIFGRHFSKVAVEHSLEKTRNFFVLWNGEPAGGGLDIYKHYEDDDSISMYGRRAQAVNDYGVNDEDAADLIGTKFISESKGPDVKVVCTIIDNNEDENMGYDIESIQPGDTCSFYGFSSQLAEIFDDNMLITAVKYFLDRVEIQVEIKKSGLAKFQEEQDKKIKDIGTDGLGVPESYT